MFSKTKFCLVKSRQLQLLLSLFPFVSPSGALVSQCMACCTESTYYLSNVPSNFRSDQTSTKLLISNNFAPQQRSTKVFPTVELFIHTYKLSYLRQFQWVVVELVVRLKRNQLPILTLTIYHSPVRTCVCVCVSQMRFSSYITLYSQFCIEMEVKSFCILNQNAWK